MCDTIWPQKNENEKKNHSKTPLFGLSFYKISDLALLIRYKIDSLRFGINS